MSKKKAKDKKPRPAPKPNRQIPMSMIRPLTTIGLNENLQRAREFPIHSCWIMDGWEEAGITPVVVAREQEPGKVMFGSYMVDLYCLGIKDVLTKADVSLKRFDSELERICSGAPEQISVEFAHEVIYGALEYAERLGFQPHPDYQRLNADLILDPPDVHPRENQVTFGKNGKPLYISGPYDDELKIAQVIGTLNRTVGEGNYHFLIGSGPI